MAKAKNGPNIRDFQKRFPDEDTCLKHLMRTRFGERLTCFKCFKEATYYRVKARRSFECEHCGYQVYPTAGTPFEKHPHAAAGLVLRHVPVLRVAERRGGERGPAPAWRDVQNGVAHVQSDPQVHGLR